MVVTVLNEKYSLVTCDFQVAGGSLSTLIPVFANCSNIDTKDIPSGSSGSFSFDCQNGSFEITRVYHYIEGLVTVCSFNSSNNKISNCKSTMVWLPPSYKFTGRINASHDNAVINFAKIGEEKKQSFGIVVQKDGSVTALEVEDADLIGAFEGNKVIAVRNGQF